MAVFSCDHLKSQINLYQTLSVTTTLNCIDKYYFGWYLYKS